MIQVGINAPVVLTKAEVVTNNDRTTLGVAFKEGAEKSLLEQMQDQSLTENSSTTITIWDVKLTNSDDETKEPSVVADELNTIKKQLTHILNQYVTSDKIKFDSLAGLDIKTDADLLGKLKSQAGIDKMYNNLINQFVAQFNALPEDVRKQQMRLLLVRQSKAKHFPTFRKKFLDTNPFLEPASVPEENSGLKFTAYEKKNGYDKGEDLVAANLADQVDGVEATSENAADVDSILGGR